MFPNFNEEKKLWKKGFVSVLGIDEAGRGPLAGPVVAAAVKVDLRADLKKLVRTGVKDSKKLSFKKREQLFKLLVNNPLIGWSFSCVSSKVIDRINIFQATKLAMKRAAVKLKPDYLLLDGNQLIDVSLSQKAIVKGDNKVFSCAAASIIAKVIRDRMMISYDKKYPLYGFAKHKGYGTKLHFKRLKKHGFCSIHRQSFNLCL